MSKYNEALEGLNKGQRTAVERIDGPVLVIAGPGTGKTQLLTTRIAHILSVTDTLPQNILCLTFTDSAAQTMRERLASMIGQGAYDVTISTYHAFGSDLIRRFPDYFDTAANLEPIDDLGLDRIIRTIIAELPFSNPLKHADNYLADIKTLISDAKRSLLTPKDMRSVAKQNLVAIQEVSKLVAATLHDMKRIDKKAIPLFQKLFDDTRPLTISSQLSQGIGQIQPLIQSLITELETAVDTAQASGKTTMLTAWKNKWLAKDTNGHFIADGDKANQKLMAAADVYESYLKTLAAQNLFDYDDMILRAVRALETNNDLRFSLQEQYQYILLDEFQDTNGAQLRLVELLTDSPVHEGRPNILAVGDDDQAIYAFQGASYSHMLQFKDLYRDVLVVPLTENYRSHSDILHTARGIAEQIEERLHHHFPQIEKVLTAKGQDLSKDVVVERREARSDVMQYSWVTQRITALIQAGIPAGDIAVLAPQHKYLEPLVPFLRQAGIPMRYEKRENVLDEPAIMQLLRMSELIIALNNGKTNVANALWAEVLSFEFWGLSTSTIWQLAWQQTESGWTDNLLANEQLAPIALFFIRLSHLARTETLESMFDYLIGSIALDLSEPDHAPFTSPFYTYYFGELQNGQTETTTFWNLLSSLIVLRARLRDHRKEDDGPLLLADFIEYVEAMRTAELKLLNTSPYASSDSAVQLMTAFKAKGMEWGVVFVLAVNDDAWGGKSHSASARISLPPNLQFIRYAGTTNDERLRLFYVAITRAKTQLYLVNYTNNFAGRTMSRLKFLDESTDEQGIVHTPLLPTQAQVVLSAENRGPAPSTELAAYWSDRHAAALEHPDMRSLLQDRLRTYRLSPTHLNAFTDLIYSGPQTFFLKTILHFPQAPSPEMQFGNAIHETLEWLHHAAKKIGALPSETQIYVAFEKQLQTKLLSTHDTAQYLSRGQAALQAYINQRATTISASNVVEYNFRNEGVFVGKAHLSGKIDKLIVDPSLKTIQIVDYKTGKSHTRWIREIKLHKYRQQLYLYKALVEGSHTYAGYTVTGAYLEFVEPDENGAIQELQLQLDDTEYKRIKRLAEAVWQRIVTLDLPDVSAYPQDMHGVEAFEATLLDE